MKMAKFEMVNDRLALMVAEEGVWEEAQIIQRNDFSARLGEVPVDVSGMDRDLSPWFGRNTVPGSRLTDYLRDNWGAGAEAGYSAAMDYLRLTHPEEAGYADVAEMAKDEADNLARWNDESVLAGDDYQAAWKAYYEEYGLDDDEDEDYREGYKAGAFYALSQARRAAKD